MDFNICDTNSVEKNCHKDPSKIIGSLHQKHPNRLIIGQLNINSIRNKFDSLNGILKNNIDVLLLSETKIDSSFPKPQFEIDCFTVYRCDRNEDGGGLLLYVRDDIPSDLSTDSSIEGMCVELNIRKKKWLIHCIYNPHKNFISSLLDEMGKNIDKYSSNYVNFILLGDFNCEPSEQPLEDFCYIFSC